ncbi:MAG: SDR family oxidoreductase [Candidatus Hydrogenedentes bacterium]|nr:SDR family oxidoreductase [Candidatus Hydrogenedentota bacterium]
MAQRRFENKSVFITGASSGIGAALGVAFAREGARVALAARNADRLGEVQRLIEGEGGRALSLTCDVTDRGSVDYAVAQTVAAFGGIDVAVANAGFSVAGVMTGLTTEDYRRQFDTNFFGVLDTIYAALPHLQASKGRLGVVSSVMGRLGAPGVSPYCASKFALCGLLESIDYELADLGVSVTCINPGLVASNIRRTDNSGRVHVERKDPVPAWIIVPTDKAARDIVTAIYKRKFEAIITGHGKVAYWITRHFPGLSRAILRRVLRGRAEQMAKVRTDAGQT